jgi:hypothetical protein
MGRWPYTWELKELEEIFRSNFLAMVKAEGTIPHLV